MAISYFEVGAYMFTFDLKSGYHHIEVATDDQSYIGFSWVDPISKNVVLPIYGPALEAFLRATYLH